MSQAKAAIVPRDDKIAAPFVDQLRAASKLQDHHRERLAIVYVRQSSPRQVLEHRESRELQYGLAARAEQFGWRKDRILVIDDDQGKTARVPDSRDGFERVLAEVSLNHVGLVLGIEMSRLARSCKDWYQLLELCALFRCLLFDQDGFYDPTDYNDRLLLGLKGTMSEAELHILRGRLQQGSWNKARRGDLITHVPRGYIRLQTDEVVLDPDEQAQSVVRLVFGKFRELGSAMSLLRYLRRCDIRLPKRPFSGSQKGLLQWRSPTLSTLISMLHNPTYAGSYAYGRFQTDHRRVAASKLGGARFTAPLSDWKVLIHDRFPAYITWETYLANVKRLKDNVSNFESPGVPREGLALLAGILFCGRCQRRLSPVYKGGKLPVSYVCTGSYGATGEQKCQRIATRFLDDLIADQVLRALEPTSLELSLTATDAIRQERNRLYKNWKQRLERAAYQAERAQRQYAAVEPENRLVARELERQWEQSLVERRQVDEEYNRFQQGQQKELSPSDLDLIRQLAVNLPLLWKADTTTHADRQTIVRHLVERVEVSVRDKSELVDVQIHWKGGFVGRHEIARSVSKYSQLHDFQRLRERVQEMWKSGVSTTAIAKALNSEGFRTPTQGKRFTRYVVRKLLDSWGWTTPKRAHAPVGADSLGKHEWWLTDLARSLSIEFSTLSRWCRRKWVNARKVPGQRAWWIVWADDDECERLRRLYAHGRGFPRHHGSPYPRELIEPKLRPNA